ERARMHAFLGELATLDTELTELERVRASLDPARTQAAGAGDGARTAEPKAATGAGDPERRGASIDDALRDLKKRAGTTGAAQPPGSGGAEIRRMEVPRPGERRRRARRAEAEDGGGAASQEEVALMSLANRGGRDPAGVAGAATPGAGRRVAIAIAVAWSV